MRILGLDLDRENISLTILKRANNKIIFESFSEFKNLEELDDFLSSQEKKQETYFASMVSANDLIIREVKIPVQKNKDIIKALPFQLEANLPYLLSEASYCAKITKENKGVRVKAFVVSNKCLEEHLNKFQRATPHFVGAEPIALLKTSIFLAKEQNLLSIYLGQNQSLLCAISEGDILASTCFPVGYKQFFEALKSDLKNESEEFIKVKLEALNLSELSQKDYPALSSVVEVFKKDCDRAIFYLLNKQKARQIEKVLFLGEYKVLEKFSQHIRQVFDIPLSIFDKSFSPKEKIIRKYALPSGVALDLLDKKNSIEFRGKNYLHKTLYKKLKQKAFFLTLALIGFCVSLFVVGHHFIKKEEKTLETKLVSFANQYRHQHPKAVEQLNRSDFSFFEKLKIAKKAFGKNQKPYKFYEEKPLLSEALHEISEIKSLFPGLNIEEFNYQLIDLPNVENPTSDYKIQLNIIVEAENQQILQKFGEKLQKCNTFQNLNDYKILKASENRYEIQFTYTH